METIHMTQLAVAAIGNADLPVLKYYKHQCTCPIKAN